MTRKSREQRECVSGPGPAPFIALRDLDSYNDDLTHRHCYITCQSCVCSFPSTLGMAVFDMDAYYLELDAKMAAPDEPMAEFQKRKAEFRQRWVQ